MPIVNGYITLKDFQDYRTVKGMTSNPVDDSVIERLVQEASRAIESYTHRRFYPRVETRYFDLPCDRELALDEDLLALLSLTNGDGTVIAGTNYNVQPRNSTPIDAVKLKATASVVWKTDSNGNDEGVIAVAGFWGYHDRYSEAYETGSTLNGAINDTTTTTVTVASGANFTPGQLIKVDNEIMRVTSVSNVTLTVVRGVNGSTAATHLTAAVVSIWRVMSDVAQACLMIANDTYVKRTGQTGASAVSVTAAGVIIRPQGWPQDAVDRLAPFVKIGFA